MHYGLTSGLPVTFQGLVGENGRIHGLNHFGYSAAATKLDNEFGVNGEFICSDVKELLAEM